MDAHTAAGAAAQHATKASNTQAPGLVSAYAATAQAFATIALAAEVRELRQVIDKATRR